MKKTILLIILSSFIFSINSCSSLKTGDKHLVIEDNNSDLLAHNISIEFTNGEEYNHPSFVVWAENLDGTYIKTIYITQSYASGIFSHAIIGDTAWDNHPGRSIQAAALPYWTYKKGLIEDNLIPNPENPFVDAYTGATPTNSFAFNTKKPLDKFVLFVEVNQSWDWNKFWTNNKYPNSNSYKHSAQPSLIYSVIIDTKTKQYSLNPIGHGSALGEDGLLYTDISTLTTAKQIFSSIKVITE